MGQDEEDSVRGFLLGFHLPHVLTLEKFCLHLCWLKHPSCRQCRRHGACWCWGSAAPQRAVGLVVLEEEEGTDRGQGGRLGWNVSRPG